MARNHRPLTKSQIEAGERPVGRSLTAKEARWVDRADNTPYVVLGQRKGFQTRTLVTGYTSARVVAGKTGTILTESEAKKLRR
jgi:hypothetical protein